MDYDVIARFLGQDFSEDYWGDAAIVEAHSMIRSLGPEGWATLSQNWQGKTELWQVRCAQILPQGKPSVARCLLFDMVRRGNRDVRVAALDSLRECDWSAVSTEERRAAAGTARALLATADKVESKMLQAFLTQQQELAADDF